MGKTYLKEFHPNIDNYLKKMKKPKNINKIRCVCGAPGFVICNKCAGEKFKKESNK